MNPITLLSLLLSLSAVFLATGALLAAFRGSGAHLSKQFKLLSESQSELSLSHVALQQTMRNLKAQVTMQTHRAKVKDDSPPENESDEELKARTRRELGAALARGSLSAYKPGV